MNSDLPGSKDVSNTGPTRGPGAPRDRSRVICLTVLSGVNGKPVRSLYLDKERIVIGSVVSADVRLSGEGVAPIQAVIEMTEKGPSIYDLASETGILVNGTKVVTRRLENGDEIRVAQHSMTFQLEDMDKILPRERFRESEDGRKLFLNPDEDLAPLLLQEDRGVEEIFDFRPTSNQALQVVMSWHETILEVEHFVQEKEVTVGVTRKSDFGIPPLLSASRFSIVTRKGGGFVLNLDPQMTGILHRNGQLKSLDQLRQDAGTPGPGPRQVPIEKDDFAKVTIGEINFYLSFTAAPPRLKRRKLFEKDAFFSKVLFTSAVLTGLTVTALMHIQVPQQLEAEQVPERIATILYQPEKFPEQPKPKPVPVAQEQPVKAPPVKPPVAPPKPKPEPKQVKLEIKPKPVDLKKPIPKEMNVTQHAPPTKSTHPTPVKAPPGSKLSQNQAKEGEGARAKGTEGMRGSHNGATMNEHQNAASRPSPEGGKGRGGGNSQVAGEGNVDFLKSAGGKIQDILGDAAVKLGKSGERLKGFGGFDTQGNGGLALSGSGKGGGGDAASLGGLGNKGIGGGRVGTGMGAAGNGDGIIGGASRVSIRTGGSEEAVVMGAIDASAVEAALLAHKDEFRLCYEKEINAENPTLSGRVGTSFVIGSSGRVTQAGIESTTLKNANVERCILTVIRRIDFPIPRGAGTVQVAYPFKYNPAGH